MEDFIDNANQAESVSGSDGALSVSGALSLAKSALESVTVKVVGEVSEWNNKAGYKAVYFTVKDENAAMPCMMWANRFAKAGIDVALGSLVELTGRFSLYAAKGRMSFEVFSIALAGEGDLRMKVAAIARKLQAEGLTDDSRKLPLPLFPQRIGVVTSPRGDAVHDVLRTLKRRYPLAEVVLAGVPVEGKDAPSHIIEGMRALYRARVDVMLVVRGGGSFEDLMPFNDEALARAIAACDIPVVTGIGHEPDNSIADLVADFRASTPTAAAEAVSPAKDDLIQLFSAYATSMASSLSRQMERQRQDIGHLGSRPVFRDPMAIIGPTAQALDFVSERLNRAIPLCLERDAALLATAGNTLMRSMPRLLESNAGTVSALEDRAVRAGTVLADPFKKEVSLYAARLHDLSPLAVLGRGYSIARNDDGRIVKHVSEAPGGSLLHVTVSDGVLNCEVLGSGPSDIA